MALINFSLPIDLKSPIPSFKKTDPCKLIDVKLFDGSITQQLLFLPDIKVLTNFFKGDLGIADGIIKKMVMTNVSKITNPEVLEMFLKGAGAEIAKPFESYLKDGRLSISAADIKLSQVAGSLGGLKALEKSLIQSIFETKKPYVEIIKLVLENIVKIEDIIARVLAVSGSSMNPKNNPRALGYSGNTDFLKKVAELDGLKNSKSNPQPPTTEETSEPDQITTPPENGITQSIFFSTGSFVSGFEYKYIYEILKPEPEIGTGSFSIPPVSGDDHLPEHIIFGVYDSNFNPVADKLINSNLAEARSDGTADKNINWINRSGKWFGRFEQIKENVDYKFKKDAFGNKKFYVNTGPSVDVEGEKKFIKKGFPVLSDFSALETLYTDYYMDETSRRASKKGLKDSQIQEVTDEISSRITTKDSGGSSGIQTTIEGAIKNGFLVSSNQNNTKGLPGSGFAQIQNPFKPKKITFKGEQVWIDPEAKYDMKIIKCDPSTEISFLDIESDKPTFKSTKIIRFVKNVLSIKLSDNSQFYYEISNPTGNFPIPTSGTTIEISIDNTRGSGLFGLQSFQPALGGTINLYSKFMPQNFRNGLIFTSPEDGRTYRLIKFQNGWKIEEIYWSINSATREGDIVSLGVYGSVKKERLGDGVERVRVKFTDNQFYYFTTFDGQFLFRKVYDQNISSIQPLNSEKVQITIDVNSLTTTRQVSTIPANSIRVQDDRYKFGKLISNTQIQNNKLAESGKPFSRGSYGTPITVKDKNNSDKNLSSQSVEQIHRFRQTEDDNETYFIIEGILSSKNKQKLNGKGVSKGDKDSPGGGDYSFPDVIGVIPVFIEMLIDVFSKLIPNITSLLNLISNPAKFITDIIIAKIGDNNGTEPEKFGVFSKKFFNDLTKLAGTLGTETIKSNLNLEGLFGNVLSSLQGNLGALASNLSPSLLNSLNSATNLFGDSAKNFLDATKGLTSRFGSFNNLQGQFGSLVNNLQNRFGDLPSNLQGIAGNLSGTLNNLGGLTGNINSNFLNNILGGNLADSLQGQISSLTGNLVGGLQGQIGNLTGNLFDSLQSGISGNLLNSLSGQFAGVSSDLAKKLQSQLGGLAGNLAGRAQDTLTGLTGNLSGTFNNLQGQFKSSVSNLDNNFVGLLQNQLNQLPGSLRSGFNNLQNQFGGALNNLSGNFSGDLTKTFNSLQSQFSNVVSNLNGSANNLLSNGLDTITSNLSTNRIGSLTESISNFIGQSSAQKSLINIGEKSLDFIQSNITSLSSNLSGGFKNISIASNLNLPTPETISKTFDIGAKNLQDFGTKILGSSIIPKNLPSSIDIKSLTEKLSSSLPQLQGSLSGITGKVTESLRNKLSNIDTERITNVVENIANRGRNSLDRVSLTVDKKREQIANKLKEFIKNTKLKNYIFITPDGYPKFIMDGVSTITLFGDSPMLQKLPSFTFGLETKLTNLALGGIAAPKFDLSIFGTVDKASKLFSQLTGTSAALGQTVNKANDLLQKGLASTSSIVNNINSAASSLLPFNLIFQKFSTSTPDSLEKLSGLVKPGKNKKLSALSNSNFEPVLEAPSDILTPINSSYETVNVQYATGDKIEGVNYKYIYVYEETQKKVLEAQKLDELGETPKAIAVLEDVQKKEPNNALVGQIIDELKKKVNLSVQPVIKFMLELVSLPLKTIFGIITYIMDFFKSLVNPFELVVKMIDFVSFKWMLDFFSPTSKNSIFALLGMKFDIQTYLTSFIPTLLSQSQLLDKIKSGSNGLVNNLASKIRNSDSLKNAISKLPSNISFSNLQGQFAGLSSQLSKGINSAQKVAGSLNNTVGNLQNRFGSLTGQFSSLQGQLGGAIDTLRANLPNVSDSFNDLQNRFGSTVNNITSQVGNLTSGFTDSLSGLQLPFGNFDKNIVGNLVGEVGSTFKNLQGNFGDTINNLPGQLVNLSGNFGSGLTNLSSNLNLSGLQNRFSNLGSNFNSNFENISSNLNDTINSFSNRFGNVNNVFDTVSSNFDTSLSIFNDVKKSFNITQGSIINIGGLANNLQTGLISQDTVNNLKTNLLGSLKKTDIVSNLNLPNFSQSLNINQNFSNKINDFTGYLSNTFNTSRLGIPSNIENGINSLIPRLEGIASNLSNTFTENLNNSAGSLFSIGSKFDFSKIIDMPFFAGKMPTYTLEQFQFLHSFTLPKIDTDSLRQRAQKIGNRFGDLSSRFQSGLSNLQNRLGGLTNNLNSTLSNLQGQLGNVVGELQSQFGNIAGNLQGQFGSTFNNLQSQFGNVAGNLTGTFNNLQGQFGSTFNNLQSQFGNVTGNLTGTFNNLQSQFGNVAGNLTGTFNNLQGQFGNVSGNLSGTFNNLQSQFGNVTGNLTGTFNNLQSQFGNVSGNLSGTFNNLQSQFGNVAGNLTGTFNNLQSNLGGFANSFGSNVTNIVSNLNGGQNFISNQLQNFGSLQQQFNESNLNLSSLTGQLSGITNNFNIGQGSFLNITNNISNIISPNLLTTKSVLGNVTSSLSNVLNSVNVVSNLNPGSISNIQNLNILKSLPNLNTNLQSIIQGGALKANVGDIANKIASIPGISDALKGGLSNVLNPLLNSVKGSIPSLLSNLTDKAKNLPEIKNFRLPSLPTSILSSILCLIESILNSIIDFIWGLLGLGSIIPTPHLKLCRDSNANTDLSDVAKLLRGDFDDPSKETGTKDGPDYNFVYNITTSDGKEIRALNREELSKFLEENRNIQVDFG